MITAYLVKYRLQNRIYPEGEWDVVVIRATTKYSAMEKLIEDVNGKGMWYNEYQITEHGTNLDHSI